LIREWLPLALTDHGMLSGVFLCACRSLHTLHRDSPSEGRLYLEYALGYKAKIMRSLNEALSKEGSAVSEVTLCKTIMLAGDEVELGNDFECVRHVKAADMMVELKGGVGAVRMCILRTLLEVFACRVKELKAAQVQEI